MKLFGLEMPAVFDEIRNALQELKLDFTTKEREDGEKTFEISYNGGKVQIDVGKDLFDFKGIKITADDTAKVLSEKIRSSICRLDVKGNGGDPAEYYYAWEKENKPLKQIKIHTVDYGFREGVFGGGAITAVWISPWFEKFLIDRLDLSSEVENRHLDKIDPMVLWKHLLSSKSIPGITLERRFYKMEVDDVVYTEDGEDEDFIDELATNNSYAEVGKYVLPAKKQTGLIWYRLNISVPYWNNIDAQVKGGKIYSLRCLVTLKLLRHLNRFLKELPSIIIRVEYSGSISPVGTTDLPLSKNEQGLLSESDKYTMTVVNVPAQIEYELGATIARALSYQMMAEQISSIERELGFTTWYPNEDRQIDAAMDHIDIAMSYVKNEYDFDRF